MLGCKCRDRFAKAIGGSVVDHGTLACRVLDALTDEFGIVDVRPPLLTDGWCWEVEVPGSGHDPFNYSTLGLTLAEAARKLAEWKGVDVPDYWSP